MLEAGIKKIEGMDPRCELGIPSYDIAQWPEFHAFLSRLGVPLEKPFARIVVDMDFTRDRDTKVYLEERACDMGDPNEVIETTNRHNREYRTEIEAKKQVKPDIVV